MELKEIANIASDLTTSVGIIAGGIWAYLKFIRYRTLRPRLNFECEYSCHQLGDRYTLWVFRVRALNIGNTKVELPNGDKHIRVSFSKEYNTEMKLQMINFDNPILKAEIFGRHTWIEPGETISDTFSFIISPDMKAPAFMIDLIIYYGERIVWSNQWIVPLQRASGDYQNEK